VTLSSNTRTDSITGNVAARRTFGSRERLCASHGVKRTMKGIGARSLGYFSGVFTLVALAWILTGQAAGPGHEGIPMDWSHHHVIFSQPSTNAQAALVMHAPRYWQQWNREHLVRTVSGAVGLTADGLFATAASRADWSENLGSGANAGAGVYPAKYSFQINSATCASGTTPDYVVFSTGLVGSSSHASIVGFDNLYSGCSGNVPTVYWAFNTGGKILTSPTISGNGQQVAFVQTNGVGLASLVLLKFAAGGTASSPVPLTAVSNASYRNCTAPCMTKLDLRDTSGVQVDDTTSSVFPDYTMDVIYVGGTRSWLFKFTGVFRGTPAPATTGGFPVEVNPTNPTTLGSPVLDTSSGNIFVGDAGGFFYRVNSTTGGVTASKEVDFGTGLIAGPIVDSTAAKVYVFASSDGTTTTCPGTQPCSAVYQFDTSFAANTAGTKAVVGTSVAFPSSPNPMFEGAFDSSYYASGNATGNLYVCGNTGGAPTLYRIPVNAGTMGTPVAGPALSSVTTGCSPVTDFSNPNVSTITSEWIYASAQASGLGNSCASGSGGGCAMNFVSTPWQPSHVYTVGQQILDTHFQIQTCRITGTSGTVHPGWATTIGGSTSDPVAGALRWVNQGPQSAFHGTWLAGHAYALGDSIIDSNGNVQVVRTAGTSAATPPVWQTTIFTPTTVDGGVRWRNAGLPATASLAAAGGTGGIIIDNVVGSGTLGGASQIYFSTQSDQACGTTGTGGCAVQASQAALQ